MQILKTIYRKTMRWAQHQHATKLLALVSFIDAAFFPLAPYFMLAPMSLANRQLAIQYALIATTASVIGGIIGYLLGSLVFSPVVEPLIAFMGYSELLGTVIQSFQAHSFWTVMVAGFMPIPFLLVTIGSGFMHVPITVFFLASLISRSLKFLAVAILVRMGIKVFKVA